MLSCEKLGPRARSRLPTLKRGRGSSWEPRDQTRLRDQLRLCESASKNQPRQVSLAFGTPFGVGTCHRHLDTHDSSRLGLGSKPPPYCRTLNIRESRRTPNLQLFQVLGFTPTLGQVRVATLSPTRRKRSMSSLTLKIFLHTIAIAFFQILGHFANFVARPCLKLTQASPNFQHFLDKSKRGLSKTLFLCFVKRLNQPN